METRRYTVKTLGCKANLYDSQLIEAELQRRGWAPAKPGESSDLCIVNSCTVTDEADRQSRKTAEKAAADPATHVLMTGCGAEVAADRLARAKGVHSVVGNQDKARLVELALGALANGPHRPESAAVLGAVTPYDELLSRHPIDREWAAPESPFALPAPRMPGESGRMRGFLKIQEGCDSFCTYCIIPYGRGPSRSPRIPYLVDRVRELHGHGAREVILTGTNLGDYGVDWSGEGGKRGPRRLVRLVESILAETGIERVRLGSLDPVEIDPELRALVATESRVCAHFHVSLQSPHSRILRLMKRPYSWEHVEECLNAIAALPAPTGGVFVGMDVITGFPGEGEEEFELGLERLRALPWTRLHVFPYSEREGTPATRLPAEVERHERARRAKALRELSLERMKHVHHGVIAGFRAQGRALDRVLIEGPVKGPDPSGFYVGGYSSNYFRALLRVGSAEEAESLRNRVVSVAPEGSVVDSSQGDVALEGRILGA